MCKQQTRLGPSIKHNDCDLKTGSHTTKWHKASEKGYACVLHCSHFWGFCP